MANEKKIEKVEVIKNEILSQGLAVEILNKYDQALTEAFLKNEGKEYEPLISAALGSIPWFGSLITAISDYNDKKAQGKIDNFERLWLREHEDKINRLFIDLREIASRVDSFGSEPKQRVQTPEFLQITREAFRAWDKAETVEKKEKIKNLLVNSAVITLCSDDVIRLFVGWIEIYHEAHFAVIKEIHKNQPVTKGEIFDALHPSERPVDYSSEAGLFSYLIRDLNFGGIIEREKEINSQGNRMRAHRVKSQNRDTMESAFEDTKNWVLTPLGEEFVRYVIVGAIPQVEEKTE